MVIAFMQPCYINFRRNFEIFFDYLLLAVIDIYNKKHSVPYSWGFKGKSHRWKDKLPSYSIDLEGLG